MTKISRIIFLVFIISTLVACYHGRNYKIDFEDQNIVITIPSPSIGVSARDEISYDGFTLEEVEEDIFNDLRRPWRSGTYKMKLIIKYKNEYGEYSDKKNILLGNISAEKVKRYVDYSYFIGFITDKITKAVISSTEVIDLDTTTVMKPIDQSSLNNHQISQQDKEYEICSQLYNSTYIKYYNERFGYSIYYPSCFMQGKESDNGDGRSFILSEDISFSVFGAYNTLDESMEELYNQDAQDASYSCFKGSWYVVSGYTLDGRIYYKKAVSRIDGSLVVFILYYPEKYKKALAPMIRYESRYFPIPDS